MRQLDADVEAEEGADEMSLAAVCAKAVGALGTTNLTLMLVESFSNLHKAINANLQGTPEQNSEALTQRMADLLLQVLLVKTLHSLDADEILDCLEVAKVKLMEKMER